ncbi:MAG TPA: hypothetical protein PL065_14255, partial [Polyangiaceae bacterium]|nr:hypothetical protein [Polyangiaceae bacterium]
LNLTYVKEVLDEERENLKLWTHLQGQFGVYGLCRTIEWEYEQPRPYEGDVLTGKRRAYLLLFYNPEKAAKDQIEMNEHLTRLQNDLLAGKRREEYAPISCCWLVKASKGCLRTVCGGLGVMK